MVEWKELGEVCTVHIGKQLNRNVMLSEGLYPVINGGKSPSGYTNIYNEFADSITISQGGESAGYTNWIDTNFWAGAHCYVVIPNEYVLKKYLYYGLKNIEEQICTSKQGAGIPGLNRKALLKHEIPIPPIEEQERIVRILDTFTAGIENVKRQLSLRRKQYEYYRDHLLNPTSLPNAEMKPLKSIGSFYGGLTGKTKNDFECGNTKFITYMNVFTNPSLKTSMVGYVLINEGERQNKVKKGDILFTGSSETPEECGMSCVVTEDLIEDYYLNSFCFGLQIKNYSQFNLHFLKHLMRSEQMRKKIIKTASGVTRFNISKARFSKILIPIPPIKEQNKIATILNQFETSIVNLQQQLTLREKQYEYYRNKLLTF